MAITSEQKKVYNERIKPYKDKLTLLKKEATDAKNQSKKIKDAEAYFRIQEASIRMQMASVLIQMSKISQQVQGIKNDTYLTDARREFGTLFADMLKILGDDIDGSLTENKETLLLIERMNPVQRLNFLQGILDTLDTLKDSMGSNHKWRWSLPENYYKLASLTKSMFDFKEYDRTKSDLEDPFFKGRQEFLQFLISISHTAAQEYRSRFELSSQDIANLQKVQKIFELLKKIFILTGNKNELERMNTSYDAVKQKIESLIAKEKKKK